MRMINNLKIFYNLLGIKKINFYLIINMTEENPNLVINQHSNINIEINKGEEENSSIKLKKEVLNKDFYLKNKREYGIDLLRILAMFMVINTHLGNGSNFNFSSKWIQ